MQIFAVTADYLMGTDHLIKTVENKEEKIVSMSNEEVSFIEELRKDKMVYSILFENPKRGADLIKHRLK